MVPRLLASAVLLSCGLAAADERSTELVPSCADVDLPRDSLPPEVRARALRQLTRVLEREQLLVVTAGCVDRYVVSHEQAGRALVVRIVGPHGSRRMRNGSIEALHTMYARMVASLLKPVEPEPAPIPAPTPATPANAEATDADADDDAADDDAADDASIETASADTYSTEDHDAVIDAVPPDEAVVSPDRILYGQLAVGSLGGGWGMGYRRHAAEHLAMDASLTYLSDDAGSALAFAVEALYVPHPRQAWTPYIGGGLSLASQRTGLTTGDGMRAEMTAGISFSRTGAFRWFAQLDTALPMFSQQDVYTGGRSYSPSVSAALGLGF